MICGDSKSLSFLKKNSHIKIQKKDYKLSKHDKIANPIGISRETKNFLMKFKLEISCYSQTLS